MTKYTDIRTPDCCVDLHCIGLIKLFLILIVYDNGYTSYISIQTVNDQTRVTA